MYGMLYKNKVLLGTKVCDRDWGQASEVDKIIFARLLTCNIIAM